MIRRRPALFYWLPGGTWALLVSAWSGTAPAEAERVPPEGRDEATASVDDSGAPNEPQRAPSEAHASGACFPECRPGYSCAQGECVSLCVDRCMENELCSPESTCVSKCNPICESWQQCTPDGRCQPHRGRPRPVASHAETELAPVGKSPDQPAQWRFGVELLVSSEPELQTDRVSSVVIDAGWNWHTARLEIELPATELYGRLYSTSGSVRTEHSRWSHVRLGNPAVSMFWPLSHTTALKVWGGLGGTVPLAGNKDDARVDIRIMQQRAFEATLLNRGRVDEYLFAVDRASALGRLHIDYRKGRWAISGRSDVVGLFPVKDFHRGVQALWQLRLRPLVRTGWLQAGLEGNAVLELTDAADQAQFSLRPFVEGVFGPVTVGTAIAWNIDEPGRQYP